MDFNSFYSTMKLLVLTTMLLSFVNTTEGINCYTCTDVTDENVCINNITTCGVKQSCFKSITHVNGPVMVTLGCLGNQQCSGVSSGGTIVGRQIRQTHNCMECCSGDRCNLQLCNHLQPSVCINDVTVDCARMDSIFSICQDIQHAKNICPKFCGLCNVVDGEWSQWSPWSVCDVSCNNGTVTRTRSCTKPRPNHGGLDCIGNDTELLLCNTTTICPVHGGWSAWYSWGSCSMSCDTGIQRGTRTCTNPIPAYFGDHCFGPNIDDSLCIEAPCADGGWSIWSVWSTCSSTCREHTGIRTQSRSCNNPVPSVNGQYCLGDALRVDTCIANRYCRLHSDCYEIKLRKPQTPDGIYDVVLWKTNQTIQVYCDMTTDDKGWTVFQNRFDGTVDFYRNYSQYIGGFGNLHTEFWLGLDYIQEMTSQFVNDLRIDLMVLDGSKAYEVLSPFYLSTNYTLNVGDTISSKGISTFNSQFGPTHNGQRFSTYDHDVDSYKLNCAQLKHGGWWYNDCYVANLNGRYFQNTNGDEEGMRYTSFTWKTLAKTKMSFSRKRT